MPKTPDLCGIAEVAELAGVSRQTVSNWRARWKDFPAPVLVLKATPVFRVSSIRRWLEYHRPPVV